MYYYYIHYELKMWTGLISILIMYRNFFHLLICRADIETRMEEVAYWEVDELGWWSLLYDYEVWLQGEEVGRVS